MIFEEGIQNIGKTIKALPRNKQGVVRTGYARVLKHETKSTELTPHVLIGGIKED